jgi:hypothetical protein
VDLKYGVTQNVTADFTYNTDFAQVEADEQQVNLTRFSLFFPEKREFFLEARVFASAASKPPRWGRRLRRSIRPCSSSAGRSGCSARRQWPSTSADG